MDDKEQPGKIEGFDRTAWLDEKIPELEQLKPDEVTEFILPPDIDHRFFISELGKPSRTYEFGGLFNPNTRSVQIIRGYGVYERGANNSATTRPLPARLNPDGKTTDDIFFHTHPWQEKNTISYFNVPENSAKPIGTDVDNVMALRMIEEEAGFERTVTSIIGSRGFISVTEAKGISLDEDILNQAGVSEAQLTEIKRYLALVPPEWTKNYAKDEESRAELVKAVEEFYIIKKTDRETAYSQKLNDLIKRVKPLVRGDSLDSLIRNLAGQFPKYPTDGYLRNKGFTQKQIELIQEMSGTKVSLFKVDEGEGLKEIPQ